MPKPTDSWRFSVVILTLNEERNLPGCLASLAGCDDVVVLDSGSTDRTAEIARAAGARLVVHPFKDFADQRNYAHNAAGFRHEWVFHLDADEWMTPELAAECNALVPTATCDGYYSAPRMMFDGHWLKRCTDFPAWQARFVHARRFRFVQVGHGQREAPGMKMGHLHGSYLHDISVSDPEDWEKKHRRYAHQEALNYVQQAKPLGELMVDLFRGPMLARRRALKFLSYRLPARSQLRYLYQYWLRGGFRDGPPAQRYCRLMARYEHYITEAIRDLKRSKHA
jgi:glycosyltransferase involved in cell wall biosynthesis